MKYWSESRAWAELAKLWDKPVRIYGDYGVRVLDNDNISLGLCSCIGKLIEAGLASEKTGEKMLDAISPLPKKNGFAWEWNKAGAKQRAAFCRRMAAKTRKKNVVKNAR